MRIEADAARGAARCDASDADAGQCRLPARHTGPHTQINPDGSTLSMWSEPGGDVYAVAYSHRSQFLRGCLDCGSRFTPARSDARYCSSTCRQRAYRGRRG
jgi:hypothetical protein